MIIILIYVHGNKISKCLYFNGFYDGFSYVSHITAKLGRFERGVRTVRAR